MNTGDGAGCGGRDELAGRAVLGLSGFAALSIAPMGDAAPAVELRLTGTSPERGETVTASWRASVDQLEEVVAAVVQAVRDAAGAPAAYTLLTAAWQSLERRNG